ncbi:hypothetical protein [Roseateles toxinivorans]|uniref:Uncharacterized protein n=1 Tax=Roseateles toxinivorans TaxID=270368 RepID=A0A4V3CTN8_9BURK|nr:hypothetical protein [Roseateles toxinivorans]TDP72994.1 hypothetical protein DES47_102740 [Roseateles toxinivorans]
MSAAVIVNPKLAAASFGKAIQPLLTGRERYAMLGVRLVAYAFPFLDVELDWSAHGRTIRLRVDGTDYPYRPVGGWWIDASGERLMPGQQAVPASNGFHLNKQDGTTPAPWFCFMGWREYHDHQGHQEVSWASIRNVPRYSVLQLIVQLQRELNKTGVTLG